jgi:hypothetical protein
LYSDNEQDPVFPVSPIKIRLRATRICFTFLCLLVGSAYTIPVAFGYLPAPSKIPQVLFGPTAFLFTSLTLVYVSLMLPPLITGYELKISREGIVIRSYGKDLIPWTTISSIDLVEMVVPRHRNPTKRIDLISDRIPSLTVLQRLRAKKWRNFRKDAIATIIPGILTDTTAPELYKLLRDYHTAFSGRNSSNYV